MNPNPSLSFQRILSRMVYRGKGEGGALLIFSNRHYSSRRRQLMSMFFLLLQNSLNNTGVPGARLRPGRNTLTV